MGSTEKVTTGLEMAAEDAGAGRFGQGTILNRVAARAYRRTPDQPCADCLDHSLAARHRRPAVPRRVAFWLVALILTVTMLGTTLPTPLYVIYQAQWHFSAVIVTVTFAVYAAGVLTALLLAGRSSVGIWRSLLPAGRPQAPGADDTSRHSLQDSSHSEGGEAACPPGLKTRVSTPRS